MESTASQFSFDSAGNGASREMPALFTTTPMGRGSSRSFVRAALVAAASVTSKGASSTLPPAASRRALTTFAASWFPR